MIGLLLALTLAVLVGLAVAFGGLPRKAELVLEPSEEVIAFSQGGSIYVVNPDGTNRRDLNVGVANATSPVFSPDGTRVAFLAPAGSDSDGTRLFIVAVDGSRPALVEASGGMDVAPNDVPNVTWSPDSLHVAFAAMDGANARIFVVGRDGNDMRAITDGSQDTDLPSWSPIGAWGQYTGDWIGYRVTEPDGTRRRFERVHPDGTNLELVAAVIGPGSSLSKLAWSPPEPRDRTIAMSYAMNAGFGSQTRAVIDLGVDHAFDIWTEGVGGFADAPVSWSPDSLYLSFIAADRDVILADDDRTSDEYDGDATDLGPVLDCWVDWSPDSAYLYGGAPNGCDGVVVVPIDDPTAATILTNASGTASWRAVPR
jgi:Tol biopolymer transport system component